LSDIVDGSGHFILQDARIGSNSFNSQSNQLASSGTSFSTAMGNMAEISSKYLFASRTTLEGAPGPLEGSGQQMGMVLLYE
jgi:hypothetical protein